MNALGGIFIMAHPKRRGEVMALRKLLELQAGDLPVTIVFDGGWNNPKGTFMETLNQPCAGTHRLVLHDDMLVPKGALAKIAHILTALPPDGILSVYCPDSGPFRETAALGKHVLKMQTAMWLQAMVYPNVICADLLSYMNLRIAPEYPYEDRPFCYYLKERGLYVHAVVPSLTQHLGAYRSTLGFAGKIGTINRNSAMFDPQFDSEAVDWPVELANPYCKEVPVPIKGVFL